jgi:carbon monoxide dehydrogenase subunit G
MTKIESEKAIINASATKVYGFLADFNNFKKLMPAQVVDWVATEEDCSFTIKGMASLTMKFVEKTPVSKLKIIPNGKTPFDFTLTCTIEEKGIDAEVQLVFDADLNMFLKMMAEKPLTNFLNLLVNALKNLPFE